MLPPVLDSHVHFRDPADHVYELLHDTVDQDGQRGGSQAWRYLPEDYFADASGIDIRGIVHIEAQWDRLDPVAETRWLHHLDRSGALGVPLAIVGFADLTAPDIDAVLERHAAFPHTRAIRQMLNRVDGKPALCWAGQDYLADRTWQRNFALLARYGLDFDAMCFGHQMPALASLAARHPHTAIHLEHAGLPWDHTQDGRQTWRSGLKMLARLPQVDVKISGLGNTIPNWTVESLRPYVLETIDIFGPSRVTFASNFPTDKAYSKMQTLWDAFDEITKAFTAGERSAMFHRNAARMYRLDVI